MKNLKAIQFLIQFLFIALPALLCGQGVINWGPETTLEDKSVFSIVGHNSESIFLGTVQQNRYNAILEFGKDKKLKKKLVLDKIIDKDLEHVVDFSFTDDHTSILILRRNEVETKNPISYVEKLTIQDDQITDRETIHTVKGIDYLHIQKAVVVRLRSLKNADAFHTYKFRNDTKLLLVLNDRKKEGNDQLYLLFDRKNDLDLISKSKASYPYIYSKAVDIIQDIQIDSKNNILVLIKNYISFQIDAENNVKEKRKGAPNYRFTVKKLSPTENSTIEIDHKSKFWIDSKMSVDSNDEIFISATYTNKFRLATTAFNANTNSKADGMLLYKFNSDKKQEFVKNHPIKELDRDGRVYNTSSIMNKEDGNIYMISIEGYTGVICEKFSSQGAFLGSDRLTRRLTILSGIAFAGIQIIGSDNKIDLIYNAGSGFLKGLQNGKSKKFKLPSKNNRIVRTSINLANLKFDHQEVSTAENMHIINESFGIINGKTYVVGFNNNYSTLRLGAIE